MTAAELIDVLQKLPPTTPVKAWCVDNYEYEDVGGVVWDNEGSHVYIQTNTANEN